MKTLIHYNINGGNIILYFRCYETDYEVRAIIVYHNSKEELLFESDEELFDEIKDILFRIPKDRDTNYYVIEINKKTINSSYKKIEKQFEKNIEVRKNNYNKLYGGKRRKSIRKRRVKKQYTKRFKKHNSRKYK